MPASVVSSTLQDTPGWPDATIVSGDAVDIVTRLKEEFDVPLRSLASLSLNWTLMAAGLLDRLQITIFPRHLRMDRYQPDPRGRSRLRPRTAREHSRHEAPQLFW